MYMRYQGGAPGHLAFNHLFSSPWIQKTSRRQEKDENVPGIARSFDDPSNQESEVDSRPDHSSQSSESELDVIGDHDTLED
jgi:hypothetical protein